MCIVSGHSEITIKYGSVVKVTRLRPLSLTRPFPHRPSQNERIAFLADQDGLFQAQVPFDWKRELSSGLAMLRLPLSQEQPINDIDNCVVCQAGPAQDVMAWGACARPVSSWPESTGSMCTVHGMAVSITERHWRSKPLTSQAVELRAERLPAQWVATDAHGRFDAPVSADWARELASGRVELVAGGQQARLWQSNTCMTCPGATPEAWGACRVDGVAVPHAAKALPENTHKSCTVHGSLNAIRWISEDSLRGTDGPVRLTNKRTGEVLSVRPDEGGYYDLALSDDWTQALVSGVIEQRDGSTTSARAVAMQNICVTCAGSTPSHLGSCRRQSVKPGVITQQSS